MEWKKGVCNGLPRMWGGGGAALGAVGRRGDALDADDAIWDDEEGLDLLLVGCHTAIGAGTLSTLLQCGTRVKKRGRVQGGERDPENVKRKRNRNGRGKGKGNERMGRRERKRETPRVSGMSEALSWAVLILPECGENASDMSNDALAQLQEECIVECFVADYLCPPVAAGASDEGMGEGRVLRQIFSCARVVVNCHTDADEANAVLQHCLAHGCDYLDSITDIRWLEFLVETADERAKDLGCSLVPGCSAVMAMSQASLVYAEDILAPGTVVEAKSYIRFGGAGAYIDSFGNDWLQLGVDDFLSVHKLLGYRERLGKCEVLGMRSLRLEEDSCTRGVHRTKRQTKENSFFSFEQHLAFSSMFSLLLLGAVSIIWWIVGRVATLAFLTRIAANVVKTLLGCSQEQKELVSVTLVAKGLASPYVPGPSDGGLPRQVVVRARMVPDVGSVPGTCLVAAALALSTEDTRELGGVLTAGSLGDGFVDCLRHVGVQVGTVDMSRSIGL